MKKISPRSIQTCLDRSNVIRYSSRGKLKVFNQRYETHLSNGEATKREWAGGTFFSNKFGNHRLPLINYNPPNSHRVSPSAPPRLVAWVIFHEITRVPVSNVPNLAEERCFCWLDCLSKPLSKPSLDSFLFFFYILVELIKIFFFWELRARRTVLLRRFVASKIS